MNNCGSMLKLMKTSLVFSRPRFGFAATATRWFGIAGTGAGAGATGTSVRSLGVPCRRSGSTLLVRATTQGQNNSGGWTPVSPSASVAAMVAAFATTSLWVATHTDSDYNNNNNNNNTVRVLSSQTALAEAKRGSSDMIVNMGTPVKEKATGILFPQLCNGYYLAGTGVRVKYGLIKVYAVGTYLDPLAISAIKVADRAIVEDALLDPNYPRTIKIVMNRNLSIEKYTAAIVEALQPRMNGQDLEKLEEFKKLNPSVDLVQGAYI